MKSKASRRKEIIKNRAETNDIETKNKTKTNTKNQQNRSMKPGACSLKKNREIEEIDKTLNRLIKKIKERMWGISLEIPWAYTNGLTRCKELQSCRVLSPKLGRTRYNPQNEVGSGKGPRIK